MTIGMAIVLVATVGFLIVSSGFRKVVGVIAAGAIALLALLWIVNRSIQSLETQALIAQLSERAGIEEGRYSGTGNMPGRNVPPRKRRRRRRKSRLAVVSKQTRRRTATKVAAVAEPAVIAAAEPKPAVRGASKYAELLGELEMIRVGISAGDANAIHKLQVRGDAVLREMAGKARLPPWLNKATRMKWRRCAERAPRIRKPRKPTPPPLPVRKVDSGWTEDANGVRSREIHAVEEHR